MSPHRRSHAQAALTLASALAAASCAGPDGRAERAGEASDALTCVTVQNAGP